MPVDQISVEDLKKMLDAKEKFVLLDVREQEEYDTAKIAGSKLIPLGALSGRLAELDKNVPIVVHCHSGGRSNRAAQWLQSQGYKASNLAGGITAWSDRIDPSVPTY
jgi:sulfur-carrier protein adenylyltransferase/sulfurtransferase